MLISYLMMVGACPPRLRRERFGGVSEHNEGRLGDGSLRHAKAPRFSADMTAGGLRRGGCLFLVLGQFLQVDVLTLAAVGVHDRADRQQRA